jgi:hypothetical protein
MNLIKEFYFTTPIYFIKKEEWVNNLIKKTDKYVEEAIKNNRQYFINNKDFGITHHSSPLFYDIEFKEFINFICENAYNILNSQGFNMELYSILISELWVQEFSKEGGGHHNSHIHSNSHISGFYFLKCSDKTSFPIFHDPRLSKKMIQLIEKDKNTLTECSEEINIKVTPGLFVFFNSYLEHQFTVDNGIESFRFIHFNLQAIPKQLKNDNR